MEAERKNKEEIVAGIKQKAFATIRERYGTGVGDGISPKRYHNLLHTQYVSDESRVLAEEAVKNGNITVVEAELIYNFAAPHHDVEQDKGSIVNEKVSAAEARKNMEESGLFPDDIPMQKVESMILGTIIKFDERGVMSQSAVDYPSMILADADLANLGGPTEKYLESTNNLMCELYKSDEPSLESQIEFWESNVVLLSTHEYYTSEAKARYSNQEVNLAVTKVKLAELKATLPRSRK